MALQVRLLGELELLGSDGPVEISARKARALLALLALRSGRPQQREHLSRLLWGDISSEEHARKSLRQALVILRRSLPQGSLVARREHLFLDAAQVEVDVPRFERLAGSDALEDLSAATAMYRGDFLEGFVSGSDLFDDWLAATRQRLREQAIGALGRLLSMQQRAGDLAAATATAIRGLSLDPLREDLHRALMLVYAEQGRLGDALAQFEKCRRLLQRELGAAPSAATRELLQHLRSQARTTPAPRAPPPPKALGPAAPQLRLVAILAAQVHDQHADRLAGDLERLRCAIVDRGGALVRRSPSGLVAVFGASATRGTEPLRALHAARDLFTPADGGSSLAVGLTYGEVMVTPDGNHPEVAGHALAQAAHLAAQADGVLASDSLQRAVRDRPGALAEFQPAPLRSGERTWRVQWLRPEEQAALPFVGRQRELSLLQACFDSCQRLGRGETLLIRGDAGIGKTRLLEQALKFALGQGYDVHYACATDFGSQVQRDVVGALARSALDCASAESAAVAARARAHFGERDAEQAIALAGGAPAESADEVERQAKRERQKELWRQLWSNRLAGGPVLVAIEDLHWVEPPARALLAELGMLSDTGPLILLATTRPEPGGQDAALRGALRGRPGTTLDLGPLSELEARDLALQLGAGAGERVDSAIRRSEGHPLFLEQLLRAETTADLPASVQAVVQARLDALEASAADALRGASVLGEQFDRQALEALLERAVVLDGLLSEGLVRGSGGRLRFSHALVREAVYATLLDSARRDLHRRAAALTAELDPMLSAEHWERAEDERAAPAYLRAARVEAAADRVREAIQLCERGLPWAKDAECRFELLLARAALLGRSAAPERAERAAREALSLSSGQGQRARAWLALAEALRGTMRDEGALAALDNAEQLTPGADHLHRSHIYYLRGSVLFPRALGRESLACHEKALEHARQAGSALAQARALSGIGDAYYIQGKMLSARASFARCIELGTREGFSRTVAMNRVMVALVKAFQLQLEEAASEMRAIAHAASQRFDLGTEALAWSSLALVPPRDETQAEQDYLRGIEVCERAGRGRLAIVPRALLVEARASRATPRESAAALDAVYARCVGSERSFCGLTVLGVMLRFAEDPARRVALYDEAEQLLERGAFVGHAFFLFIRAALHDCLVRRDLERARHYAARLERENPEERLAWAVFFGSWSSALIAWLEGPRDAQRRDAVIAVRDWAESTCLYRESALCLRLLEG